MKTYKQTIERPCLVIEYDQDPLTPRDFDGNLGYFITVDRDYRSPDNNETIQQIVKDTGDLVSSQQDHIKRIKKEIKSQLDEKVIYIWPVVKYEHTSINYSLGTKHGFDYSNNGFYIVTDKTLEKIYNRENTPTKKQLEKQIQAEINLYNKYVNGDIYQFALYDENGDFEDSCCGFYDIEDIREYLPEEYKNENLKDYFIN